MSITIFHIVVCAVPIHKFGLYKLLMYIKNEMIFVCSSKLTGVADMSAPSSVTFNNASSSLQLV